MSDSKKQVTFQELRENLKIDHTTGAEHELISVSSEFGVLREAYIWGHKAFQCSTDFLMVSLEPQLPYSCDCLDSFPRPNTFPECYLCLQQLTSQILDMINKTGARTGYMFDYYLCGLWPKNPGVYFDHLVCQNTLDLVMQYPIEICHTITHALYRAVEKNTGKDLKADQIWPIVNPLNVLPHTDPLLLEWENDALEVIKQNSLATDVNRHWREIKRDVDIILTKLESEYYIVRKKCGGPSDSIDSIIETSENIKLTDTESNLLEALGDDTMFGQQICTKAGYDCNSHFRQILSNLCKRQILSRNQNGYFRCQ